MDQTIMTTILYFLAILALYLSTWISCAAADDDIYISFPIKGNVYPDGQYNVTILIGNPPAPYTLDIDTGSDVTWVQCDAPCTKCYQGPNSLYKKNHFDFVLRNDPICMSLHPGSTGIAGVQCYYLADYADYADGGSSFGVLVKDIIDVTLNNGPHISPQIAFGCGYDQVYDPQKVALVDGILGLGKGGSGILAQLSNTGVTRNIVGHCLSSAGGGYLIIGSTGPAVLLKWKSILEGADHYYLGAAADVIFDGKPTDVRGLQVIFDSGSTYTYLPSPQYDALLDLINKTTNLNITTEDKTLPVCWEADDDNGGRFASVGDAATHFKNLALTFTQGPEIVDFELRPESYLIVSSLGNVCLGILNGMEVGLGEDVTLIGDISMQDTLVVYDNNKQKVGWIPANCTRFP